MRHHHDVKKGFTLIELLVVVAIIVLLISILLPSLGRARRNARAITGLANLKQIGVALSMYGNENRDYLPFGWEKVVNPSGLTWYWAINPYLVASNTTLISKVFKDPTAAMPLGNVHYTSNPLLMPENTRVFASSTKLTAPYRFSQILPMPSDIATVFDGSQMEARSGSCEPTAWQLDGGKLFGTIYLPENYSAGYATIAAGPNADAYGVSNWAYPPGGQIRWRQRDDNSANLLFSDGHAECRAKNDVRKRNMWAFKPGT